MYTHIYIYIHIYIYTHIHTHTYTDLDLYRSVVKKHGAAELSADAVHHAARPLGQRHGRRVRLGVEGLRKMIPEGGQKLEEEGQRHGRRVGLSVERLRNEKPEWGRIPGRG